MDSPLFRKLTLLAVALALLLIFVGGLIRLVVASPALQGFYWLLSGLAVGLTISIARRGYREDRRLLGLPAVGAVSLGLLQAILAAVLFYVSRRAAVIAGHLLAQLIYLALILYLATAAHLPLTVARFPTKQHKFYIRSLLIGGAALILLLISGAIVSGAGVGATAACPDWPLCRGEIFPAHPYAGMLIQLLHRFIVAVAGVIIALIVLQTRRRYADHSLMVQWATVLGFLFLLQAGLGGLNVLLPLPTLTALAHLTTAALIWGNLVILGSIFFLSPPVEPEVELPAKSVASRQKAVIFFRLTKPWVMVLLLVTTAGAMFIAAGTIPPLPLMLYTLLGGALSAGGASVLNSYVDTDIDRLMSRTSRRPTVTGLVTPAETLFFGLLLSLLSFVVFAFFVNLLSAVLSTIGLLYYVFLYTLYLKRATIHNIIIGGAAGAIPPLVGWTAVTNSLDLGAFYLFTIIFFWTPPHTWALALLIKKDYAQAHVPMLPVVAGERETAYQILLYSILLVTLTLLPFVGHLMSLAYLIAALVLGIPLLRLAWQLWRNFDKRLSKRLYKFSQTYLALLFLAMVLDRLLIG